jgi:hypothetical protein
MRRVLLMSLMVVGVGCSTTADVATVAPRASFDMGCPEAQLNIVQVDEMTAGVTGCGEKKTYVLRCPHDCTNTAICPCTWELNS